MKRIRIPLAHLLASLTIAGEVLQLVFVSRTGANFTDWGLPILLFTAVTLAAGWLIAWRRPGNPLGWILIAIPFLFALQGPAAALGDRLAPAQPHVAAWLLWYGGNSQWSWIPPVGLLFTQLPLRFPTGALPTPRWRWFSWFTIGVLVVSSALLATTGPQVGPGIANPTYVDWGGAEQLIDSVSTLVLLPAFLGSLASLLVRYRRAEAVVRAQLRWVFWSTAVVIAALPLAVVATIGTDTPASRGGTPLLARIAELVVGLGYSLIPLSILFAVLRRGLYSIDRIISRTAAYAIVTIVVVATYAVVVLLASLVVGSTVGTAVGTLAAAGVFLPVLRWVRRGVDRVFDRARYDAERVVVAFGERIRNGADPHTAGLDLLEAVEATLQPVALGLWVRGGSR